MSPHSFQFGSKDHVFGQSLLPVHGVYAYILTHTQPTMVIDNPKYQIAPFLFCRFISITDSFLNWHSVKTIECERNFLIQNKADSTDGNKENI